jgi:4-hydroxybenzoate polyprenyltransferase
LADNKDYGAAIQNIAKAFPVLIKSRLEALFLWIWSLVIFCMIAGRGSPPIGVTILTVLSGSLIAAAVYIYNDYADLDMDKLNPMKVKRSALAAGTISKSSALSVIIILSVVGLGISFFISYQVFALLASYYVLFIAYSHPKIRLKKMFLVKEIVTTGGLPIFALVASYAIIGTFSLVAIFASLLFGLYGVLMLPVISDTLDEKEDQMFQVKSLARALSWRRRVQLMAVAMLVMMTVVPITYNQLGLSVIFPIAVVALSLVLLRWGIYPLRTKADKEMITKSRKLVFIYYLIAEIILVVSTMSLNIKIF